MYFMYVVLGRGGGGGFKIEVKLLKLIIKGVF